MAQVIQDFAYEALYAEPNSTINKWAKIIVQEICGMESRDRNENFLKYCFAESARLKITDDKSLFFLSTF